MLPAIDARGINLPRVTRRPGGLGDPAPADEGAARDDTLTAAGAAPRAATKPLVDKTDAAHERMLAMIARQQQKFDQEAMERSELQREATVLESLLMAQLKQEADNLKEWIRMA